MKNIFYILFLLPLTFLSQQKEEAYLITNIKALQTKNPNWKEIEAGLEITLEEKLRLISSISNNDSTEDYCKPDNIKTASEFLNHYKDVFHFVDIDNDSDIDVIFSGLTCPGIEAGVVNIYINKKKVLKKRLHFREKLLNSQKIIR